MWIGVEAAVEAVVETVVEVVEGGEVAGVEEGPRTLSLSLLTPVAVEEVLEGLAMREDPVDASP